MPVPPIPPSAPELQTADHVRAVLEACGYRSTAVLLSGTRELPAGCRVSIQFGDLIATERDITCMTVRCSIVINGAEQVVSGASCWQMSKVFRTFAGADRLDLAIEADLLLGRSILLEDVLARCDQAGNYLRRLVVDLRSTLQELPVQDSEAPHVDAPTMRIDARFVGDIASGRSGIVRAPGSSRTTAATSRVTLRHRQIITAACDCLVDEAISELTRVVQGARPRRASHHAAEQEIVVEQSLTSSAHSVPALRTQSAGPGHHAAATVGEPLQTSTSIH